MTVLYLEDWGVESLSSGCCNKLPQKGGLHSRHELLTVLQTGSWEPADAVLDETLPGFVESKH